MGMTLERGARAGHVRAVRNRKEFHMLSRLTKFHVRHQSSERGATAIEYGLMVSLIAVVVVVVVSLLGTNLNALFNQAAASV
jgi:pilus assembly protein Flp/PilA